MAQVRQHVNARLTPRQRRAMVDVVIVEGWGVAATAERFQVDPKTVRKWRDRFVAEGPGGLVDRSSRPHRSPGRSSPEVRAEVIRLRRCRRRGAAWIAHEVGVAPSTVQKILTEAGLGRLDRGDRATAEAPVRYQRERPGELVHVDIKKLPAIPLGGGWRVHGRGQAPTPGAKAGYRYLHTALDDRTRLAYSEHLDDERGETAAEFWSRANAWFGELGITCERVITDNGGSTAAAPGTKPANAPARRSRKPAPTGPRPTAKSNASTAPSSRNGPTSAPGPANNNAKTPTGDSSTTTITTEPTARSTGKHPPAPSGTTSPACHLVEHTPHG